MKRALITLVIIFIALGLKAQFQYPIGTPTWYKKVRVDSVFWLNTVDTIHSYATLYPGALMSRTTAGDASLYLANGQRWVRIGSASAGGGAIDSAWRSNDTLYFRYASGGLLGVAMNYYTKTQLQTSGQSSVHWGNIVSAPDFALNDSLFWSRFNATLFPKNTGDSLQAGFGKFTDSLKVQADTAKYYWNTNQPASINLQGNKLELIYPLGNRVLIPRLGALYTFGDSQTEGGNASGTHPYSDGVRLYPQYRWTNILASYDARGLTLSNFGIGSTKMSWFNEYPFIQSIFNCTGQLDTSWTGVAAVMGGWNNLSAASIFAKDTLFFQILQRSHEAMIARLIVDNWAGLTFKGWASDYATNPADGAYNWTTTGHKDSIIINDINSRKINPFYLGAPQTTRQTTLLFGGNDEYAQFTLVRKKAAGLFYETTTDGGTFFVTVNGNVVYRGNSDYNNPQSSSGGSNAGRYPQVVWLDNLPDSAIIRFTSDGAGNVYFLGFGFVNRSGLSRINSKHILYGSTTGNLTARNDTILTLAAKAAQSAVQMFSDYPVYYANNMNGWVQSTDSDPNDPAHLTPSGNWHVVNNFNTAVKLPFVKQPEFVNCDSLTLLPLAAGANRALYGTLYMDKGAIFKANAGSLPLPTGVSGLHVGFSDSAYKAYSINPGTAWTPLELGGRNINMRVNGTIDALFIDYLGHVHIGSRAATTHNLEVEGDINASSHIEGITELLSDSSQYMASTEWVKQSRAPSSGGNSYIQNRTSAAQDASFNINANGTAKTFSTFSSTAQGAGISFQSGANSKFWINENQNVLAIGGTATNPPASGALNVLNTGSIGIGNSAPAFPLHITAASGGVLGLQSTAALSANSGAGLRLINSGTPTAAGQMLGFVAGVSNPTGSTMRIGATIRFFSNAAWTDGSNHPGDIAFWNVTSGTTETEKMRIAASGNVGINTAFPSSFFQVRGRMADTVVTVTGNTTLNNSHSTILVNNTGSATITLPAAATCAGAKYVIKKISAASNDVIIDPDSAETIDAAASKTLTLQYSSVIIQSNGTGWHILSSHAAATTL